MESKTKILIIDDEPAIRNLLRMNLSAQGFQVFEAGAASRGLLAAEESHPHLIILDLGLPDMGGLDVLKKLREWTTIPILILTVSDNEASKVELLDAGANDYLTKPFSLPELMARIRAALRQTQAQEAMPVFKSGPLEVDLSHHQVKVDGVVVKLTATEYEVLSRLVRQAGRVVPQTQLLSEIWGPGAKDQTHYLRIYVGHLRKKIEKDPANPQHLITEPGVGYRIV
ncbi:MAG: response regulator [Bdellovibrionaceae bacterium]|nr:response regulator [Pseudobdellovibrionaceae bacterium]